MVHALLLLMDSIIFQDCERKIFFLKFIWERENMKTLIVYYSWHNGNTRRIAEMIHEHTGGNICAIDTAVPYPSEYRKASDQGKKETETGYMPQLKEIPYNVRDYDRIIVGTPTWWYTMAPAVLSFLKNNDFTGKTVIPFMTNAGWPGTVIEDMKKACPGAVIEHPFEVLFDSDGGSELKTPEAQLNRWISSL